MTDTHTRPTSAPLVPGALLATTTLSADEGGLELAARAAQPVLDRLARDGAAPALRGAQLSLSPRADLAGTAQVRAHAMLTALVPARTGTTAEVVVTLTSEPAPSSAGQASCSAGSPAADSPTTDSPAPEPVALGTVELSLATDLPAPAPGLAPGTKEWARLLHRELADDAQFRELIETYDGTIGLRIAGREVHIRCYRGQVLETVPRSIHGADFLVDISGAEFVALMTAESNTFMEAAMQRRLSSTGSGYEYLRMTTALIRIIDVCRGIAADAGWGHPGSATEQPARSEPDRADAPAPHAPTQNGATA